MSARRVAAFHEAAHGVAQHYVGATVGAIVVDQRGGGFCEGTGVAWRCASHGQYAVWDYLLFLLSGGFAEARVAKKSATTVFLTTALDDMARAQQAIDWLVANAFAEDVHAAWLRAECETRAFLAERWGDIERVAAALAQYGRLEAEELVELLARASQQPLQQRTLRNELRIAVPVLPPVEGRS